MNFFQFCPSNPELFQRIIPETDDVKQLAKLCLVSRSFRDLLFCTLPGRSAWLQTASMVTGYDGSKIIDIRVSDFQYQLKLLVCPWLSSATPLHFEYPEDAYSFRVRINLIGHSRLLYRLTEQDGEQAENNSTHQTTTARVFSFNAMPCKSEQEFDKSLKQLPNSSIPTFYHTIENKENKINFRDMIPMFADNTRHVYRQINKMTHVVLESTDDEHCMGYSEGGVYFMSNRDPENPKMLRHMKFNFMNCFLDVDMCAGPQKLWLANSDCISYFGPRSGQEQVIGKLQLACDKKDSLIGRMTAAVWMAYQGNAKGAISFMENELHGLDINTKSYICGRTLLHYAVYGDHPEAIKDLVEAKADVNQKDSRQNTPLMMAACCLDAPCIEMLCKLGADINLAGNSKNTPLHCMKHGQDDYMYTENIMLVLKAFVVAGVDLNQVDVNGETILFQTSITRDREILQFLISNGANPHHRNNAGNTALHTFFQEDDVSDFEISRALVMEYSVDVNTKNNLGLTPLSMNIHSLTLDEIRLLVEELRADTSVKTKDGLTLLQAFDQNVLSTKKIFSKMEEEHREIRNLLR